MPNRILGAPVSSSGVPLRLRGCGCAQWRVVRGAAAAVAVGGGSAWGSDGAADGASSARGGEGWGTSPWATSAVDVW